MKNAIKESAFEHTKNVEKISLSIKGSPLTL